MAIIKGSEGSIAISSGVGANVQTSELHMWAFEPSRRMFLCNRTGSSIDRYIPSNRLSGRGTIRWWLDDGGNMPKMPDGTQVSLTLTLKTGETTYAGPAQVSNVRMVSNQQTDEPVAAEADFLVSSDSTTTWTGP